MVYVKNLLVSKYSIYFWLLFVYFLFFWKNLFGIQLTAWDARDVVFTNFLYFSDSIKYGTIPFWNPLIQSGAFFYNINNISLFTVFQIPFILLSWIFDPSIVFEWMIHINLLIGGLGFYYFIKFYVRTELAIYGAIAYILSVQMYLMGQPIIIVSIASLPWLLHSIHLIDQRKYHWTVVSLLGQLTAQYMLCGYHWMNFVNLAIWSLYLIVYSSRKGVRVYKLNFSHYVYIFSLLLIYTLMLLPALKNLNFNYSSFSGNFQSIDPGLRSLGFQEPHNLFNNIFDSLVALIEPKLYGINLPDYFPTWSTGIGLVSWSLLIVSVFIYDKKFNLFELIWISISGFFFLFSSAVSTHFIKLTQLIPIFNSNRWYSMGLIYVSISTLIILLYRYEHFEDTFSPKKTINIFDYSIVFSSIIIILTNVPNHYVIFFIFLLLPILVKFIKPNTMFIISLILINIIYFYFFHQTKITISAAPYRQIINNRIQKVEYNGNQRKQFEGEIYNRSDISWLTEKSPSTHGYDNTGNPWSWAFKNDQSTKTIIKVTRNIKPISEIESAAYINDNEFFDDFVQIIKLNYPSQSLYNENYLALPEDNNFLYQMNMIKTTPNAVELNVKLSNSALISFNSPYTPDWKVIVNGEKKNIIKTNGVFMGIFIPSSGNYSIKFYFSPVSNYLYLISSWLIFFMVFIIIVWRKSKHRLSKF